MTTIISVLDLMENMEKSQWLYSYEERWFQLKRLLEQQRAVTDAEQSEQADDSSGLEIPEGYDAICGFCHYPFIFKQAKGSGTKEWKKYCCSSCENGTTEKRSRR